MFCLFREVGQMLKMYLVFLRRGTMKKYLFLFLILFPSILFSADLRNLSVSPSTVSPGQQVTISFEYYVPDWGQFAYFAAISNQCSLRSADTSTTEQQFKVRENCMDCEHAYVNGGRQSVQHQVGGWRTSSEIDSNILLTVPSDWSSGTYYIIVGYKDFNIYVNPNLNQVSEQCFSINVVSELTSTPTETPTEVIGSATPVEFHVEYKSGSSETNIIKPFVRIYNDSDTDLQLGDAVIKYWYKYEGVEQVETVTIYSASVNGASYTDVKSYTFGEVLLQDRGDQNRLMQIRFSSSAGVLGPGEYLEVQSGIQKADFSDYDQTNDWGYNSSFSDFSAWGRVVMDSNIGIYSSEPWHRQSPPIVIRVNVGDPFNDYIDTLGNTWERTRSYAPGGWGYGGPAYGGGNPSGWQWLPDTLDIGNTLDDPLYRKIAMSQLGSPLRYLFDIPNAEYEVTLKFNQFDYPVPSVFDVEIEGNNVLSNYSIHSEVGYNTAKDYTFNVVLTDGQLNIDLIPIQQWALVAAIEVREIAVDTPTYTPTETFTNTNTETFTDTPTDTVTDTSTETFTETNTETFTDTPTETFTDTFTETFTDTLTDTPTETFTDTNTNTYTETYTDTPTETFTETETYTITETFTITDTPTETHTNTDTETPTETTTPFIVPTNVIETKDCAIHWLHSMQILDQAGYPHEYGSWANQNEWGYNDPIRTNVGMTGLVILSFLNEGVY
ncbi:MAG: malectin domain-containing carbohydrate-binding protein, partial [Bacteroidota bacterium]